MVGQLTRAVRERPAGTSAVSALRDTLVAAAQAGQAPYGMQADMIPWWQLAAALAIAACRTVHLQAIRRIVAGEDAAMVAARHPARIRSALTAVDQMMA